MIITYFRLYQAGIDFNSLHLHPTVQDNTNNNNAAANSITSLMAPVQFPVPCGTPRLGALVSWDHSTSWNVPTTEQLMPGAGGSGAGGCMFEVDMAGEAKG